MIGDAFGNALFNWQREPSPENTRQVAEEGLKLMQRARRLEQLVAWYEQETNPEKR